MAREATASTVGRMSTATALLDLSPEFLDALPDEELLSRVRTLLRGSRRPERLVAGDVVVDPASRTASVRGLPVPLAAKEFDLLARLASDPTRVFTKDQLLREVWQIPSGCRTRTVDSHASRLRRKLSAAGGRYVVNVWGVGYKLVEEA